MTLAETQIKSKFTSRDTRKMIKANVWVPILLYHTMYLSVHIYLVHSHLHFNNTMSTHFCRSAELYRSPVVHLHRKYLPLARTLKMNKNVCVHCDTTHKSARRTKHALYVRRRPDQDHPLRLTYPHRLPALWPSCGVPDSTRAEHFRGRGGSQMGETLGGRYMDTRTAFVHRKGM